MVLAPNASLTPPPSQKWTPQYIWRVFLSWSLRTRIIAISVAVLLFLGLSIARGLVVLRTDAPAEKTSPPQSETQPNSSQNTSQPPQTDTPATTPDPNTPTTNTPVTATPGSGQAKPSTGGSSGSGGGSTGGGGTTTPPPPSSSRPSASNTGVPAGTSLSNYGGPSYNTDPGIIYDGVNFPSLGPGGYYTFTGNNLTFRNCKFNSGVVFSGDNLRIEHCEIIDGFSLSGTATAVAEYNNVHSFTDDGIHLTSDTGQASNVTIAHNFIHNPTPSNGAHADGLQVRGVAGLTLTNNVFDMGPWFQVGGQDALNAAIFLEGDNGGNSNVTLNGNYLNGGGYILRINTGVNHKFINNRFGPNGYYGVVLNSSSGGTITQWSGNVMDADNTVVNP